MHSKSILSILTLLLLLPCTLWSQAIPVQVKQVATGEWMLLRDSKPYEIRGVGGSVQMKKAKEIGANSIRTWGLENAQEILDEAHKLGLTVMLGMWVPQERQGFNYNNDVEVQRQIVSFKKAIDQFKDHPALLMWGIGNEVDLMYTNTKVWSVINEIATYAHQVDPNHPTCTVTAGLDADEVKWIQKDCPAIDIYGINTYKDIEGIGKRVKEFGWKGPYVITEWGPDGYWQVASTSWKANIEQSSTEKAKVYETRFKNDIVANKNQCLGSYVFLWGNKQEHTSTWFGLFNKDGYSCEAVDVLNAAWNPASLTNHCPQVLDGQLNGKRKGEEIFLQPGYSYEALIQIADVDQDKLHGRWSVVPESRDLKSGGDVESEPPSIPGLVKKSKANSARIVAPEQEGAYRLFYEVTDGHGHYGYINIPFFVKKEASYVSKKKWWFKPVTELNP
jgi:hypothetical protein